MKGTFRDSQWVEFGAALKRFHSAELPLSITGGLPREDFSPRWRDTVRLFMERIQHETFDDPVAAELAAYLKIKSGETLDLVARAEGLAQRLREQTPAFILCHADIHAWNLLVCDGGAFYIVDWDTLMFAPKERDLMFIGGRPGRKGAYPAGGGSPVLPGLRPNPHRSRGAGVLPL